MFTHFFVYAVSVGTGLSYAALAELSASLICSLEATN